MSNPKFPELTGKIMAVTGHRPQKLGGFAQSVNEKLVRLAEYLIVLFEPKLVITGMALGWDQAVAQACINKGVTYHAYIPFIGQEGLWQEPAKELYQILCDAAEEVIVCSPPGFEARKMHIRNEAMVDACDFLLALYDGSAGGTGGCVNYAKRKGVVVKNCWPNWIKGVY